MDNIIFTPNFDLNQLLASPTAERRGFTEQQTPAQDTVNNLQALAVNVLQPIRDMIGKPVIVSSGYRCTRLNTAVGGEPTSQHLTGQAADVTVPGMTPILLYTAIKTSKIPFDQLIVEHDMSNDFWVHISWNPNGIQRGECMTGKLLDGGGTVCEPDGYGSFLNKQA